MIESRPSLQVEWQCSSARMSLSWIRSGQLAALGGFDFAAVLAQLGGYPGQTQGGVDLFFGGAEQLGAVAAQEGLVGEGEPLLERQLAQADVVVFGAGGVLQGSAKALGRMHPELGTQVVAELEAGFGLALAEHPGDVGQADEGLHHGGGISGGSQQVDIADGGTHAAQAAGGFNGFDAGHEAQDREGLLGEGPGFAERRAPGAAGERLDASQDAGFGFGAHAGQVLELASPGGGFQPGQVGDAQLLPEQGHFLGTQIGHLQDVSQGGGHFGFELVKEFQAAGGEQLADLLGDGFTDAGDLGQLAVLPKGAGVDAQVLQAVGGFAVGEDLVDQLAFDLEQVGDLLEDGGQLVVGVGFVAHRLNDTMRVGGRLLREGVFELKKI